MALEWVLRKIQVGPLGVRRIQLGLGGLHIHRQPQLRGLHKSRFPQLRGLHKNHLWGPRGPGGRGGPARAEEDGGRRDSWRSRDNCPRGAEAGGGGEEGGEGGGACVGGGGFRPTR